jgi:hypothetical protein
LTGLSVSDPGGRGGSYRSSRLTTNARCLLSYLTPAISPIEAQFMASPLKPEFDYYLANQDEMVRQYNGRFVVIKNRQVIGAYDELPTAVAETQKTHALGTFLVQKVEPGTHAYTQTFHSHRIAFTG